MVTRVSETITLITGGEGAAIAVFEKINMESNPVRTKRHFFPVILSPYLKILVLSEKPLLLTDVPETKVERN
jgi:hypothetical protein